MIPLPKDCPCLAHEGPHELAEREATKARHLAFCAEVRAAATAPGRTRAQNDQAMVLLEFYAAEAARDLAAHCRWMHRLGLAAFCRGCWQGFRGAELPATCGCGRAIPAMAPIDLLAIAERLDRRGAWPPGPGTTSETTAGASRAEGMNR